MSLTELVQDLAHILKDGIDPLGDRFWTLGISQEVSHARDDEDVGFAASLAQGFAKDTDVAARDDLGSTHLRIGTNTSLVHMGADIGVN